MNLELAITFLFNFYNCLLHDMIEILQRSYNPHSDTTLTTLVAEYPRIIHAEMLTHRVL